MNTHKCFKIMLILILHSKILIGFAASHHPQTFLNEISGSKDEGKRIVQHYCAMCHAEKPLVQLGAPTEKSLTAWELRLKQGMDVLFKHTEEGFNAMPARGGCFECTDEQLKLAITELLPTLKKDHK